MISLRSFRGKGEGGNGVDVLIVSVVSLRGDLWVVVNMREVDGGWCSWGLENDGMVVVVGCDDGGGGEVGWVVLNGNASFCLATRLGV